MRAKTNPETPMSIALDAMCEASGISRRQLSIDAGLSESAIKHIVHGDSASPRIDTLAKLSIAASSRFHFFMGAHGFEAVLGEGEHAARPIKKTPVSLAKSPAQILYGSEEAEWLSFLHDMRNDPQLRKRAFAMLRALSASNAA